MLVALFCSSCGDDNHEDQFGRVWKEVVSKSYKFNYKATSQGGLGAYHTEYGILYRNATNYDAKFEVEVFEDYLPHHSNTKENLFRIDFYNYGGEIIINNKIIPDVFFSMYSRFNHVKVIQIDDISYIQEKMSEGYGTYMLADIRISPQNVLNDVVISPLATKYINSSKLHDNGTLIFVRFETKMKYLDYVFLADFEASEIIEKYYDKIAGTVRPQSAYATAGDSWKSYDKNKRD